MAEGVRLTEMLKCAKRELAMRRATYPRLVERHAMMPELAERETRLMADIVQFLQAALEAP